MGGNWFIGALSLAVASSAACSDRSARTDATVDVSDASDSASDGDAFRGCIAADGAALRLGQTFQPDFCSMCECTVRGIDCSLPTSPSCWCTAYDGSSLRYRATGLLSANYCWRCSCNELQRAYCEPSGDPRCADAGADAPVGVRVCHAPDGEPIRIGSSWYSIDGCTSCRCTNPVYDTGCTTNNECARRPGAQCIDQDGRYLAHGQCTALHCRDCCCSDGTLNCTTVADCGF